MKTRNNQLVAAAIFSFIFLVGNVSAKGTEIKASSLEIIEEKLELENWMINENYWNNETTIWFEQASDVSLELESWMTDKNVWKANKTRVLETELDEELVVEDWMKIENNWNNK